MARTIATTVYTWDELTETAKRRFWESGYFDFSDDDYSDFNATLDKFCDAFDASCWGWNVSGTYHDFSACAEGRWTDCPEDPERAAAWIYKVLWTEYHSALFKGKYYSTGGKFIDGRYSYKYRHSRVLLECNCPLTGICYDMGILGPMLEVLDGKRRYTDPDDLINDCIDCLFRMWSAEIEYHASFDYFNDTMYSIYPEMEFTADGRPWQEVEE